MKNPTKPAKPKITPFLSTGKLNTQGPPASPLDLLDSAVLLLISQTFPAQERLLWLLSVALDLGQVHTMEVARRRQVCINLELDPLRCFIGSIRLVIASRKLRPLVVWMILVLCFFKMLLVSTVPTWEDPSSRGLYYRIKSPYPIRPIVA